MELSLEGIIRALEQPYIMNIDQDMFPLLVFMIEYGRRIIYLTWMLMKDSINGDRFNLYIYFSLEF